MAITSNDVVEITGTKVCPSKIDPFIEIAACDIEAAAVCAGVSDACKDSAHAYLAAHYFITSPIGRGSLQVKREKLEDVRDVTYSIDSGERLGNGILSTAYGATANRLMRGCLATLEQKPASVCLA